MHHVAATAARANADPIDRSDLPRPSSTRVNAAKKGAEATLRSIERGFKKLEAQVARATTQREIALGRVEEALALHDSLIDAEKLAETEADELRALIESAEQTMRRCQDNIDEDSRQLTVLLSRGDLIRRNAEACRLVQALADVDRRWNESGSGSPADHPDVKVATVHLATCRAVVEELDALAEAGTLAQDTMKCIESANERRIELEHARRGVSPDALAEAIATETALLNRLGFDSMIDYKIAMSTRGVGLLATSRRQIAQAGLAEAESRHDTALIGAARCHEELDSQRQDLLNEAAALTGADPEDAQAAIAGEAEDNTDTADTHELEHEIRELEHREVTGRNELLRLSEHGRDLRSRSAQLATATVSRAQALESAEVDRAESEAALGPLTETLEALSRRRDELAARLAEASEKVALFSSLTYLPEDVDELREDLLAALASRAELVTDQPGGPAAVVIDDPLGDLSSEDACALFDTVLTMELTVPAYFVTSRPELLSRARKERTEVHVVDGRARLPRPPRWGRRRSTQLREEASVDSDRS